MVDACLEGQVYVPLLGGAYIFGDQLVEVHHLGALGVRREDYPSRRLFSRIAVLAGLGGQLLTEHYQILRLLLVVLAVGLLAAARPFGCLRAFLLQQLIVPLVGGRPVGLLQIGLRQRHDLHFGLFLDDGVVLQRVLPTLGCASTLSSRRSYG